MSTDIAERLTAAIADDLERHMNTGSRVYVVDRVAMLAAYRAVHARLFGNHDPGDEDRSER